MQKTAFLKEISFNKTKFFEKKVKFYRKNSKTEKKEK